MASLSTEQTRQFWGQGYLVVEDLINVEKFIDPMVADYAVRLDEIMVELHALGELASAYRELPFAERLTRLYSETRKDWSQYFDFSLALYSGIKPDEPCFFPPSVFNMLRNPTVLDVVESLIGSELYSNPVQHIRIKPPESAVPEMGDVLTRFTPWHQDASVVVPEADSTEIITVWIPVTEATIENGCMQVVPNNHHDGLYEHCPAIPGVRGKYLSTRYFDADSAVALPMKPGSALFMTRTTPHSSLPNNSDSIRWSMDLRYNPIGQPTGRPEFPGFVARSRKNSESEFSDPIEWRQSWLDARAFISSNPDSIKVNLRSWTGAGCA